ncbi:Uncharacterised protein [Vibrio cholerae]|nr:Uncharacterised protein [Vibrio cholerae]
MRNANPPCCFISSPMPPISIDNRKISCMLPKPA